MPFRVSVLFLISLPLAAALADELRTIAGKAVSGDLKSIDDETVVFETKDGPVATPLSQTIDVMLREGKGLPSVAKYTDVRLIDDAVLHCTQIRFEGVTAELTLTSGAAVKLPVASIVSILRGAEVPVLRKKFDEISRQKVRRDRIVILRDGELNPLEGTLGDIDPTGKTVTFKRDEAEAITIQLERLAAFVYFRPEGPTESPICKVIDRDGNVLAALKVGFKDKNWRLTTTFGAVLDLPADAVAKLDFNMGKLTYLSDLEPARVIERSGIGLVVKHRKDANLDGEPIFLDRRYPKGLSMHAHTELDFDLGGKFKSLKGILGIDVRTGADSQPLVTIYCDGEKRFSETITAKGPRPINLDVRDVTTLRIVVSSRNDLDLHDHVSFAEARVSQ